MCKSTGDVWKRQTDSCAFSYNGKFSVEVQGEFGLTGSGTNCYNGKRKN